MFITIILECSYSSVTAFELVLMNRMRMKKKKWCGKSQTTYSTILKWTLGQYIVDVNWI